MDYKSAAHSIKNIATKEIEYSTQNSIFEAGDFVGQDPDFNPDSYAASQVASSSSLSVSSASSSSSSGGGGSSSSTASAADSTGFITQQNLDDHNNDVGAHAALLGDFNSSIGAVESSVSDLFDTDLSASNVIAGTFINFTSGTNSGRQTLTINASIERGVIGGASINGTSTTIAGGPTYTTGKSITATIANTSFTSAITIETNCSNGNAVSFDIKSGYSGTNVNGTFDIHWIMI